MSFTPYTTKKNECKCLPFGREELRFTPSSYVQGPENLKRINVSVIFRKCTRICAIGLFSMSVLIIILLLIELVAVQYSLTFSNLHFFSYATYLLVLGASLSVAGGLMMTNVHNRKLQFMCSSISAFINFRICS